jgi:hypothetical protein
LICIFPRNPIEIGTAYRLNFQLSKSVLGGRQKRPDHPVSEHVGESRSRIILAPGELEVCDGAHWLIVMKRIYGSTYVEYQHSDDPQAHFGTGNS